MQRIGVFAAVLVLSFSAMASEKWPAEPEGFAGVAFGTPMDEALTALNLSAQKCKNLNPAKSKGVVKQCTNGDFPITEGINVVAEFQFVKGEGEQPEFNGVELTITNRRFSDVKQMLFQKYGPPQVFDNKQKTDWILTGATWKEQQYGWYGDKVSIFINEPPQPMARSTVHIARNSGEQVAGEEKAKKKSAFD